MFRPVDGIKGGFLVSFSSSLCPSDPYALVYTCLLTSIVRKRVANAWKIFALGRDIMTDFHCLQKTLSVPDGFVFPLFFHSLHPPLNSVTLSFWRAPPSGDAFKEEASLIGKTFPLKVSLSKEFLVKKKSIASAHLVQNTNVTVLD